MRSADPFYEHIFNNAPTSVLTYHHFSEQPAEDNVTNCNNNEDNNNKGTATNGDNTNKENKDNNTITDEVRTVPSYLRMGLEWIGYV